MQSLDQELERLRNEVTALGDLVEKSVLESVDMLKRRDVSGAQRLILLDQRIKKKRFAIEMDCLTLIITQEPGDGDIHAITAMLEIATELERMGEYTRDMARMPFVIIDGSLQNLLVDIHHMAGKTQDMLHHALEAFMQGDVALARSIPAEDGKVDVLYNRVYGELLAHIRSNSHKKSNSRALVNQARYLARTARNLERFGDQVATICQWVVFSVTGAMMELENEKEVQTYEFAPSI